MRTSDLGEVGIEALALDLVEALFDHLPRAPFCVKDRSLRFVACNVAMLELSGVQSRAEFIGRTSKDFFAAWDQFEGQDRQVIRTRKPVRDQLHLQLRMLGGPPVWLLFGRWPIIDAGGEVVGIAVIARNFDTPDRLHPAYERLATAIDHIQSNFGAPIDFGDLARRLGTSLSQLERSFVNVLGILPRAYLGKVRFEAALDLLKTEKPIIEIAHICGYADQSAFTRRFKATTGMSPSEYRRDYNNVLRRQEKV